MLYELTQGIYAGINTGLNALYAERTEQVSEQDDAGTERDISVLIPIYQEDEAVVQESLDGLLAADYPADKITPYIVFEEDDDHVSRYMDELVDAYEVVPVAVEEDSPVWDDINTVWGDKPYPQNKARAMDYALYSLDLDDTVVTVLDGDTTIPDDLFTLANTGLDQYDIVQAKQTVKNRGDGALPMLESAGMAGWTDTIYTALGSGKVPYQLLGKGYFIRAKDLYDLDGWDPAAMTEDMALGVEAYKAGLDLGILDTYVEDLCPTDIGDWVEQKRRWLKGPYPYLFDEDLSLRERARFTAYTVNTQVMGVTHMVGVPAGGYELYDMMLAGGDAMHPAVAAVSLYNGLNWAYYSYRTGKAADEAQRFDTARDRVTYHLINNPLSQVAYATTWAAPTALALKDAVTGTERDFTVTPKTVSGEQDDGWITTVIGRIRDRAATALDNHRERSRIREDE